MIEKKGVEVSNVPGIGGSFRVEATGISFNPTEKKWPVRSFYLQVAIIT